MPQRSWKQRLGQMLTYPTRREALIFINRTVEPALKEVANEFEQQGYHILLELPEHNDINLHNSSPILKVVSKEHDDFFYEVLLVDVPPPTFSGKAPPNSGLYYRLEVATQTGSGGYDLMGLTKQQVIDDVLDQYEAFINDITNPNH